MTRRRVVMPVVLPILVLLCMAAFILTIAALLLYNTHYGALMLAAVTAAGILFTVSLASSQDKLDTPRRAVVMFAAALPVLVGGGIALGLIGDVDDEDRMINVEPSVSVPEDAPIIAAENSQDFCLDVDGTCEPVDVWEVVPSAETENIAFLFDNREAGIQHNVVIMDLAGTADAPEPGDETYAASDLVTGPVVDEYLNPEVTWDELPEEWYFLCAVHPNMNGVGRVVADGDTEGAADGGGDA